MIYFYIITWFVIGYACYFLYRAALALTFGYKPIRVKTIFWSTVFSCVPPLTLVGSIVGILLWLFDTPLPTSRTKPKWAMSLTSFWQAQVWPKKEGL